MANNEKPAAEDIAHLTLEHLKYLRASADRVENDIRDLKFRMGQVEQTLLQHSQALNHLTFRLDKIEDRLTTMEKRLGLIDA